MLVFLERINGRRRSTLDTDGTPSMDSGLQTEKKKRIEKPALSLSSLLPDCHDVILPDFPWQDGL